jgi:hypothetical protein
MDMPAKDMPAKDEALARIAINDARLGEHVELVEPAIVDVLRMNEARAAQAEADQLPVVLCVIALCLRVDGQQFTAQALSRWGARKMKSVMALTGQALEMAGFTSAEEIEDDGGPKG